MDTNGYKHLSMLPSRHILGDFRTSQSDRHCILQTRDCQPYFAAGKFCNSHIMFLVTLSSKVLIFSLLNICLHISLKTDLWSCLEAIGVECLSWRQRKESLSCRTGALCRQLELWKWPRFDHLVCFVKFCWLFIKRGLTCATLVFHDS